MKLKWKPFCLTLVAACVTGFAYAADKVDIGKQEYETSCANCHGLKGEGNGPFAASLKTSVPKLTTLSKKNGGVFPYDRVYDTIDGRYLLESHGRDMPIWGNRYCTDVSKRLWDDYPADPEAYVRSRIVALIDYLNRLQHK